MGMVITSRPVTVTVSARTRITTEPKVLTQVEAGFPVSLSVQATSTASETYQWFKRGVALANTSNITGVTTPTLNIRALAFADTSGAYYCVVTGGCATVRSRDARVYIPQTFVTLQPRDTTVCSGDTVVLRAAGAPGGGDAAVSYSHQRCSSGRCTPDRVCCSGIPVTTNPLLQHDHNRCASSTTHHEAANSTKWNT
jgi:hypothetical protein